MIIRVPDQEKRLHVHPRHRYAFALMLASIILFTLEVTATRYLAASLPTSELVLLRTIGGVVLIVALAIRTGGNLVRTSSLRLHLMRGVFSAIGLWSYFYMFSHLPLATATSLVYTWVIFLMVLSALVLHERVTGQGWLAAIVGFVGVLVATHPSAGDFNLGYVAALITSLLQAAIVVTTRMLTGRDSPETIMFYVVLIAVLVWAGPGIASWQAPVAWQWPALFAIGLCGPCAQYLFVLAYRAGEASALAPYDYLRLIFNGAVGAILFSEFPDRWTFVGGLLIVLSSIVILISNEAKGSASARMAHQRKQSR
jgi:drug/metabolite transporter (DMT)-like permease